MGNKGPSHYFLPPKPWETVGHLLEGHEKRNRTSPNAELQPPGNTQVTFNDCANSPWVCSVPAALRNMEHIPARISAAYLQCHCLSSRHGAGLPGKTPNWSGTGHQSCGETPREHSQHTAQPWIAVGGSHE